MKAANIRIVLLACIVTLILAFGAQRVFYRHRVTDPLLTQIKAIPGIADVCLVDVAKHKGVVIELLPGADLKNTYASAKDLAQGVFGDAFAGITVADNRDQVLEDSFYQMHFYVQQGIATGEFTAMAAGIEDIARQYSLTQHKVFVGEDSIYVQLGHGEHCLYEIVNRMPMVARGPAKVVSAW